MRKKLIIALIASVLLLAAAIGVAVYLTNQSSEVPAGNQETAASDQTGKNDVQEEEPSQETVNISLPTEIAEEAAPEDPFDEDNVVTSVTVASDVPATTEDPESNVLPEDEF